MKNNYCCIDSSTFEIINNKNVFVVDSKLAKTISILNKKGYYVDMCNVAKISRAFMITDLVHNLIKEKVLDISIYSEKIKKAIKYVDVESTMIIFKDNHKFDELPNGYVLHDNTIFYCLSILKDNERITFKSLVELDHELTTSLNDLQDWAEKLQSIV